MRGVKQEVSEEEFSPPTSTAVGTKNLDSSLTFHAILRENALYLLYPSRIPQYWGPRCCTKNRKVAGSIPDCGIGIFH